MNSFIKRLSEPKIAGTINRIFWITLVIAFLVFGVILFFQMSGRKLRYFTLFMPILLLLIYAGHLAFECRWPGRAKIVLRILTWCWIACGLIYLLDLGLAK